jgi:translation initiation factor IF-3
MPPEMALQKAMELGLDLVEVSPESRPPVCRILDYGKYKYALKKKESEARKNQVNTTVKEVKFRPKIERHDYDFKVGAIKRFLGEGHKAKVTMMFRGREIAHQDIARGIMQRILQDVKEVGTVEQFPKLDGRNMVMVVAPQGKFGVAPTASATGVAAATPRPPTAPTVSTKPTMPKPATQEAGNAKV